MLQPLLKFAKAIDCITEWQGFVSAMLVLVVVAVDSNSRGSAILGAPSGCNLFKCLYRVAMVSLLCHLLPRLCLYSQTSCQCACRFFLRQTERKRTGNSRLLGTVLFLILCIMGSGTVSPVWRSWVTWEMSSDANGLPRAPVKSLIVIAFCFLLLQAIAQAIKYYAIINGHHEVMQELLSDEIASSRRTWCVV